LFTIDWPEPFVLVMIEAMACETPLMARYCGSVPAVINSSVTGFIATSIEEMVEAAGD
jgi:glycosyltransferase involved in cell wall biosynthesis